MPLIPTVFLERAGYIHEPAIGIVLENRLNTIYDFVRKDIMTFTWFRSTKELTTFVQKDLAQLPGLKDTETFICLQVIKGRYMPNAGV